MRKTQISRVDPLLLSRLSSNHRLNLATAYAAKGDLETAEKHVVQAYAENPDLKDGYARIGWQYYWPLKQYDKVIEYMEEDSPIDRLSPIWRVNLARAYLEAGRKEDAVCHIDKAMALSIPFTPAQYMTLMPILAYLGREEEITHLLNEIEAKYSPTLLIESKIRLLHPLMLSGNRTFVEDLVADIQPHQVQNALPLQSLAFALMYLNKFDQAENVFALAEQSQNTWDAFHLSKSNLYLCRRDYEAMAASIETDVRINGETPANLLHKAFHALYTGQYQDTLRYAENLIDMKSSATTNRNCAARVMRGLAQRAMGLHDQSLQSFRAASEQTITGPWAWIADFERAITLIHSGKYSEAEHITGAGAEIEITRYNSKYNPCVFLRNFFRSVGGDVTGPTNTCHALINAAQAWLYPNLAEYRIWMLILALAITQDHKGSDRTNAVATALLSDPALPKEIKNELSDNIVRQQTFFGNHEAMAVIARALAPYGTDNAFERKVLFALLALRS